MADNKLITKKHPLIVILGPTASGKTRLAAALAYKIEAEIISADSRQVYSGMSIGTGKDLADYVVKGQSIPYHLIDIQAAGAKYDLSNYQRDFAVAYTEIINKDKPAILSGGTGLYISAVLHGYTNTQVPVNEILRNELANKSTQELQTILTQYENNYNLPADTQKRLIRAIEVAEYGKKETFVPKEGVAHQVFGIHISTEERRNSINKRLSARMQNGLIEEVEMLLKNGISHEQLVYYGLEYKYISQYLQAKFSKIELIRLLQIAIHQYAKRQMTYFRKMEKDGIKIHWLDGLQDTEKQVTEITSIFYKKH